MMRISATLTAALCLIAFAVPAAASACRLPIPPNQPEADEYTESLPDGIGFCAPDRTKDPDDVLDDDEIAQLGEYGAAGAELAALAASTAPGSPGGSSAGSGTDAGTGSASQGAASDADDVGNLSAASYVPSEDGLGSWLWVIVVVSAVAAAGYALYLWTRGRRA